MRSAAHALQQQLADAFHRCTATGATLPPITQVWDILATAPDGTVFSLVRSHVDPVEALPDEHNRVSSTIGAQQASQQDGPQKENRGQRAGDAGAAVQQAARLAAKLAELDHTLGSSLRPSGSPTQHVRTALMQWLHFCASE